LQALAAASIKQAPMISRAINREVLRGINVFPILSG
jgi:hypothetical protein